MRVSQHYKLGRSQPTLDFVDVDVRGDARVFIDPRALRLLPSAWGDECVSLIQDFFTEVLREIRAGNDPKARQLLSALREPNETHLGLSRGRARGRALGRESARDVWSALKTSDAVASGLLEDLEDSILMVEGIGSDIISDITTNIIRQPLIEYTQSVAGMYGIPLEPDIYSGPLWDPQRAEWVEEYVSLPRTTSGKLLLVPKVIVRSRMDYDVNEYYRHYLLEYLRDVELSANTELVYLLKDGRRRVNKTDLSKKYGSGKSAIVRETRNHPEVLERYRADKRRRYQPPMEHEAIAESEGTPSPDWQALLQALLATPTGPAAFAEYERAIESLLSALFYPTLANPTMQREIHQGRKRIDLTYTNVATSGFFGWVSQHYSVPHVFVECKNYAADPGNPELDQLSSRFSPSRGQLGILTCRNFKDKGLFLRRCRDTANDQRGYILVLDDEDLSRLVEERISAGTTSTFDLLKQQFDGLIM